MAEFGLYKNGYDTDGRGARSTTDLAGLAQRIRSQRLARATARMREIRAADVADYDRRKAGAYPAFSTVVQHGKRGIEHAVEAHSGFVPLDYDHLDAAQAMAELRASPHVALAHVSASGEGVRALVPVAMPGPIPARTEHELDELHAAHEAAWEAAKAAVGEIAGHSVDRLADFSRLNFLCHDPDVYVNEAAVLVEWDVPEVVPEARVTPDTLALPAGDWRDDEGFVAEVDRLHGAMLRACASAGDVELGRHPTAVKAVQRLARFVAAGRVREADYADVVRSVCSQAGGAITDVEITRLIGLGLNGRVGRQPLHSDPLIRGPRELADEEMPSFATVASTGAHVAREGEEGRDATPSAPVERYGEAWRALSTAEQARLLGIEAVACRGCSEAMYAPASMPVLAHDGLCWACAPAA